MRPLLLPLLCYAALALIAGVTLTGKFRVMVWVIVAALALKTYAAIRRPGQP